tara:strand:- start:166 stop:396 length:231 start_codon:yes stop_codon:yes gene_type:complete
MKRIKYIMMIAGFAAMGCGQSQLDKDLAKLDRIEIDNYAHDMKSHIYYDIENGVIDAEYAVSYLEQLDAIIELNKN